MCSMKKQMQFICLDLYNVYQIRDVSFLLSTGFTVLTLDGDGWLVDDASSSMVGVLRET